MSSTKKNNQIFLNPGHHSKQPREEGGIVVISRIMGFSNDGQWMKVELLSSEDFTGDENIGKKLIRSLPNRESASDRIEQVQAAFELANGWTKYDERNIRQSNKW